MKNMRFYIVLCVVLVISFVLLGLSYSLPSGTTEYQVSEVNTNEMRVVYSSTDRLYLIQNTDTSLGITNLTSKNQTFAIYVTEEKGIPYTDVYYSIHGEEHYLENHGGKEEIYRGSLSSYGSDGDYVLVPISLYSKSHENAVFSFSVAFVEEEEEGAVENASE